MNKLQSFRTAVIAALISLISVGSAADAKQPFKWPSSSDKAGETTSNEQAKDSAKDTNTDSAKEKSNAPTSLFEQAQTNANTEKAQTEKPVDPNKPPSAEAIKHYNRGVELHQSGFMNQAIEEYKLAVAAAPRLEQAWSNLGGIYAAQRSYNKAMESFEKALELKPDRPTTLNGLATVLYARGKIQDAKEKWMQALNVDPNFVAAYYNIGNAFEGEKKPLQAIEWYVKAIDKNPKMADAYFRVGCIYSKEHHPAQAELMLDKAVQANPEADFVKEAKRLMASIRADYQHDMSAQGEVRMNIVPPTQATPPERQATAVAPSAVPKTEQSAVDQPAKSGRWHKKKKHEESSAPADNVPAAQTSDLEQKPTQ